MTRLSRKCVPFTPFDREISSAAISIVSAAGVHRKDQEPFDIANELGDLSYRVIDGSASDNDLAVAHDHYDHADADRDINVVFPISVLRSLAEEGYVGGVARKHIGFMGYTMRLREMYEDTAPRIADEIDRGSGADAVVLTGG